MPRGQAQRRETGEGWKIRPTLGTLTRASAVLPMPHTPKAEWGPPCPLPKPTYLHLHHPVHQDGTHVLTDVWLLLHVVGERELLLPRYKMSRNHWTPSLANEPPPTLRSSLPGAQSSWAAGGPAHNVTPCPDRAATPARHHPPLFPACTRRSPWRTLRWRRGRPAAPCLCPLLPGPGGMQEAVEWSKP